MDKIRSLTSKLPFSSSSTPGAKLSKAFKFDKEHNVLGSGRDPFSDGPIFEEPSLSRTEVMLHCVAAFFCFLAICTMGAVAGFQAKWIKVSGGTGFVLFMLILTFLLTVSLLCIPLIYDRWDKLKRPAQFLAVPRSTLILSAFGTGLMLLSSFIVTISAWTAKGCKNADNDPHADLGDDFKNGLKQWCTTKKASAIFDWFAFAAWAGLLVLTVLAFRRERRRDPGFVPPSNNEGISYANVADHVNTRPQESQLDDPYADKHETIAPAGSATGYENYGYNPTPVDDNGAFGRPSMDTYGAFSDGPGRSRSTQPHGAPTGGDETSRTMQLAYTDPYAQIRQSLMAGQDSYSQAPPAQYGSALPNPPQYGGGYR